jgi:HlyD family secretion protein
MKKWKKIAIAVGVVVVLGVVVLISVSQANKDVVTVQTGKVGRGDLVSLVTASGEIRPKNYTNVLGEGTGKITEIVVKEGDLVKKGDATGGHRFVRSRHPVRRGQLQIGGGHARTAQIRSGEGQVRLGPRQGSLQGRADREAGL